MVQKVRKLPWVQISRTTCGSLSTEPRIVPESFWMRMRPAASLKEGTSSSTSPSFGEFSLLSEPIFEGSPKSHGNQHCGVPYLGFFRIVPGLASCFSLLPSTSPLIRSIRPLSRLKSRPFDGEANTPPVFSFDSTIPSHLSAWYSICMN